MFSVFLSSYRNTRESLGDLEKAVETLAYRLVFAQYFSFSQTSTRISITRQKFGTCFLFLNITFVKEVRALPVLGILFVFY